MILFQIVLRKRLLFGTIVVLSIVIPVFLTTIASMVTDIIGGMCLPWIAFRSQAAQLAMTTLIPLFIYALPTLLMVFCYSRIIYTLTHKVRKFCQLQITITAVAKVHTWRHRISDKRHRIEPRLYPNKLCVNKINMVDHIIRVSDFGCQLRWNQINS